MGLYIDYANNRITIARTDGNEAVNGSRTAVGVGATAAEENNNSNDDEDGVVQHPHPPSSSVSGRPKSAWRRNRAGRKPNHNFSDMSRDDLDDDDIPTIEDDSVDGRGLPAATLPRRKHGPAAAVDSSFASLLQQRRPETTSCPSVIDGGNRMMSDRRRHQQRCRPAPQSQQLRQLQYVASTMLDGAASAVSSPLLHRKSLIPIGAAAPNRMLTAVGGPETFDGCGGGIDDADDDVVEKIWNASATANARRKLRRHTLHVLRPATRFGGVGVPDCDDDVMPAGNRYHSTVVTGTRDDSCDDDCGAGQQQDIRAARQRILSRLARSKEPPGDAMTTEEDCVSGSSTSRRPSMQQQQRQPRKLDPLFANRVVVSEPMSAPVVVVVDEFNGPARLVFPPQADRNNHRCPTDVIGNGDVIVPDAAGRDTRFVSTWETHDEPAPGSNGRPFVGRKSKALLSRGGK